MTDREMNTNSLALPNALRTTAIAYPKKVRAALATIENGDALKLLRGGDAMMRLVKDYGADTEAVNAIQLGRLHIQARLGELMPAKSRAESGSMKGKAKGSKPGLPPLSKPTLACFRKVEKNAAQIDAYHKSKTELAEEMSTAGFINWVGAGGVMARLGLAQNAPTTKN